MTNTQPPRPGPDATPDRINILDVMVDPLTTRQLNGLITAHIDDTRHSCFLNVNVHCLNLATELTWLRDYLNDADVVFCDGAGVMLGARILGHHIPERITYADWMWDLAAVAAERGYSFYFVGARPGVAAAAAARLQARYPSLIIAGVDHGYFDKTPGSPENEAVIGRINAARPHILLLGFGMPLQEQWLRDNWSALQVNIGLTGGAVFDYLSGELKRAPRWMTDNGLEWLGRLLIEPGRLWQRYVLGNPKFLARVLAQRLRGRT